MIIYKDNDKKVNEDYSNQRFWDIKGSLTDHEARLSLVEFFRYNPDIAVELLFGMKLFPFQSYLITQWWNNSFSMNIWSRGGSKCIVYDSDNQFLIEKDNGIINLKNLIPNINFNEEKWIDIRNLKLWNGEKYVDTNKLLIQPNKPCLKIKTNWGYELEAAETHKVKVINFNNNNCNIIWKHYSEITLDDFVCINTTTPYLSNNNRLSQTEKDECYLLGLLVGDGCYCSPGVFKITSADEQILNFVKKYTDLKACGKKNNLAKDIGFKKSFYEPLMKKYDIQFSKSYDKYIPENILRDFNKLIPFLQGLFDTDGTASKYKLKVSFCTVSEKLAKQVHISLLSLGILSHIKIKKTNSPFGKCYLIDIGAEYAKIFYDIIGFRLSRKKEIIKSHLYKKLNTNINVIPGSIPCVDDILIKNKKGKTCLDQKNLSYKKLQKYLQLFKEKNIYDPRIKDLEEILEKKYFFDRVVNIEKTVANCVDFNIPDGECYWSNGFISHNSFSVAIFCLLYGIFNNDQRIILTSASFRSSRAIMAQMEKFIQADVATLLRQCYPHEIKRATDLWEMRLPGGGCIKALPLNEKIRGQRADILICDEGLLISKTLMEGTIKPFLLSKSNVQEQLKIREYEEALIKKGVLKEEDRTILESEKKMIILSSASFEFEYLYEIYKSWLESSQAKNSKYFVNRLSYAALPKELVEEDIIKEAESAGIQSTYFQREYMAKFPSASDGYFNLVHMNECTIPAGDYPCVQMIGSPNSEYILSIDPSFSSSKTSDFFAMGLFLVDKEKKSLTLVNSYGTAGGKLSQHIEYLYYLLKNFNIVLITADLFGGFESGNFNFLESANQSSLFKDNKILLKPFEGEFNSNDYIQDIGLMRKTYCKEDYTICYRQKFTSQWIKDANEYMQYFIQTKKLFFASKITNNDKEFERIVKAGKIPVNIENDAGKTMTITELCDEQDNLIDETKNQITLICPRISANGVMSFDLPPEVKAIKGEKRARRDNYTTTLMACWASRFYFDYIEGKLGQRTIFQPRFIA